MNSAAAYLAGLLTLWGIDFEYVPSDQTLPADLRIDTFDLFIFSDYPAAMVSSELQQAVVGRIAGGASLLMIGGWESFHGLGGDWDGTAIGNALPVEIGATDDRLNCDSPVFVRPTAGSHPVTAGLPWLGRPPLIGGFNRVVPRSTASVLLEAVRMQASASGDTFELQHVETHPLLIVGESGSGKTAAFATDVAPHWIGPMVDWGDVRVTAQAEGTDGVEVGSAYAQFLQQLIGWL
jgi:uncharacterized membrane protein